jgi:hypothetical protein
MACACASAQRVTYHVVDNARACVEVRIPKWTRPEREQCCGPLWPVGSWGCQYELRSAGGTSLYVGLSCAGSWRMQEKYAVDLSHPKDIRRIDETTWDVSPALKPTQAPLPAEFLTGGMRYKGHVFPKPGSKWDDVFKASLSPGKDQVAVYSYDGTITRASEHDMSPFFWKSYGRISGTYWTEIYDVSSVRRLIQISGIFRGVDLTEVQGGSYWMGDRFYLMPLKPEGMRSFLICDVDKAAEANKRE